MYVLCGEEMNIPLNSSSWLVCTVFTVIIQNKFKKKEERKFWIGSLPHLNQTLRCKILKI